MRATFAKAALLWTLPLFGCFGEPDPVTLDEPIAIVGGHFKAGTLPGTPPETEPRVDPKVTSFEFSNAVLRPGQQHISFIGRVTEDAASIAIALEGVGTGYWIHTTGPQDPQFVGERIYDVVIEIGHEVPAGRRRLLVAAIDDQGRAGTQSALDVCIASALPDNGYACRTENVPPAAILELAWSEDVDLDLAVSDPGGRFVNRQDPLLLAGDIPVASLTTDSNPGCHIDGRRREYVVWPELPGEGLWSIYANLYEPCGHLAVTYRVTQYLRRDNGDGTYVLEPSGEPWVGRFLRAQANGDNNVPLFVGQLSFQ